MRRHVAVLALVVVVVLAGCGGPGTENETTTESNSDGTPAVALPPNETVAESETTTVATEVSRAAAFEAVHPALAGTDGGPYSPASLASPDSFGLPDSPDP